MDTQRSTYSLVGRGIDVSAGSVMGMTDADLEDAILEKDGNSEYMLLLVNEFERRARFLPGETP